MTSAAPSRPGRSVGATCAQDNKQGKAAGQNDGRLGLGREPQVGADYLAVDVDLSGRIVRADRVGARDKADVSLGSPKARGADRVVTHARLGVYEAVGTPKRRSNDRDRSGRPGEYVLGRRRLAEGCDREPDGVEAIHLVTARRSRGRGDFTRGPEVCRTLD